MRKISIILAGLVCILLMILSVNKYIKVNSVSFTTIVTFGIFIMLFLGYVYFEKNSMGTKEIAIIATLSAFAALARVVFAPLPNIKPTTFIVAISGYVFGPFEGFLVGSNAAFISNIFMGQGPWTPWQMAAWGIVGAICGFLGKKQKQMDSIKFSILCFLFGFMFDWIVELWFVAGGLKVVTWNSVLLAYMAGFNFDIMHAIGNFVFSIIFYDNFLKVLNRYKKRLQITYIKEVN